MDDKHLGKAIMIFVLCVIFGVGFVIYSAIEGLPGYAAKFSRAASGEGYPATRHPLEVYGQDARAYCVYGTVYTVTKEGVMQQLMAGDGFAPIKCKE